MKLFKLIAQDKANHEVYGSRIAACFAVAAAFLLLAILPATIGGLGVKASLPLCAFIALASAAGAGWINERLQARANKKAEEAGERPVHEVSKADIVATAKGGLSVSLPLFAVWLIALMNG